MFDLTRLAAPHALIGGTLASVATKVAGKIDKSAKDFESILLGGWLQQAEQSFAKVPGTDEEESGDDSTVQMQSGLAMQPLGEAMAANGGIGIARMIAPELQRSAQPTPQTFAKSQDAAERYTLPRN